MQRYVFESNRLRDAVGASALVHRATSDSDDDGLLANSGATFAVAGGGNAVLCFDSRQQARGFVTRYTGHLLDMAPGLEVSIQVLPDRAVSAGALIELRTRLAHRKAAHEPHAPLLGLGVVADCVRTGLPAVAVDGRSLEPISTRIQEARFAGERATEAEPPPPGPNGERVAWPLELDHLNATKGERSQLGIVHVDGNGVGEKLAAWLADRVREGTPDVEVADGYSALSVLLTKRTEAVRDSLVSRVSKAIEPTDDGGLRCGKQADALAFALVEVDGAYQWPLRWILAQGDELTFIADGRIALDLAAHALRVFSDGPLGGLGPVSACAGVAIVPAHSPFSSAYDLAARLCKNAKAHVRAKGSSALDWNRGLARPDTSIEQLRKRQYGEHGTARPYVVSCAFSAGQPPLVGGWEWLTTKLLDGPRGLRAGAWAGSRNKVKALGPLVREGRDPVKRALSAWNSVADTADLVLPEPIEGTGYLSNGRTPLLDALELLDLHMSLDRQA